MSAPWNGRPPAPLDEVDGWFLFTRHYEAYKEYIPLFWSPGIYHDGKGGLWAVDDVAETFVYECPLLTPDQIAAQIAEAVKAEREACIATCNQVENRAPVSELIDAKFWIAQCRSAIRSRGETV